MIKRLFARQMEVYATLTDDYDPWDNAFTGTINTVKVAHKLEGGQVPPGAR
jgi:hypothetical protein